MELTAITVIDDGKSKIQPGTVFDCPEEEALPLINCGAATEVVTIEVVEPEPDPDPGLDDDNDSNYVGLKDDSANPDTAGRDPLTGLPTG